MCVWGGWRSDIGPIGPLDLPSPERGFLESRGPGLLGGSSLNQPGPSKLIGGSPLLHPRVCVWGGGGPCTWLFLSSSSPQGLPIPSRGVRTPGPTRAQGSPCNRSLCRMWPRHLRRTCLAAAPRTARPGAERAERGKWCRRDVSAAPDWGPAKCSGPRVNLQPVTPHPNLWDRRWRFQGQGLPRGSSRHRQSPLKLCPGPSRSVCC